ncbi:substrate-binding domain-containing protein [Bacillus sp. SL00103]
MCKGKTCPGDVSIIGFDDIAFSSYTTPALTTVKKPIEKNVCTWSRCHSICHKRRRAGRGSYGKCMSIQSS